MKTAEKNEAKKTALESQISESMDAVQNIITGEGDESISQITYRVMAHAAGLAMLNAVNQQQQFYALQNAMLSVAVKEALASNSDEALKLVTEAMKSYDVLETFNGLKRFMDDLTETCSTLKS